MASNYALVTGASGGIGLEFSKLLAADGYSLVLAARSKDTLLQLAKELKVLGAPDVVVLQVDLSKPDAGRYVAEQVEVRSIKLDVIINNAGFGDLGPFAQADWDKLQRMIRLNMEALTQIMHLGLPWMVERNKGMILNVASTAAFQPGPLMAVYYATKAYVLHLSEAVWKELKASGSNVTVTALCPGPTDTGFADAADVSGSKLFDRKLPTAAHVAAFGYKAMKKGKRVAIHGWQNRMLMRLTWLVPRSLLLSYVYSLQRKK